MIAARPAARRDLSPRLTATLARRLDARPDHGFSLIELLVVILIIAVLAAIAVPMFLSMQDQAHRSTVETDIHHVAVMIESERVKKEGVLTLPSANEIVVSDGVTIDLYFAADALTYYLRGGSANVGGGTTYYFYGTAEGGVIGWSDDADFVSPEPLPGLSATYVGG